MLGLKNALKGVQYANPALGERLYELCRKATSRHIDRPDEIINQQVRVCVCVVCFKVCSKVYTVCLLCGCQWSQAVLFLAHCVVYLLRSFQPGRLHASEPAEWLSALMSCCCAHTPTPTGGIHDQQRHARLRRSTGGWLR